MKSYYYLVTLSGKLKYINFKDQSIYEKIAKQVIEKPLLLTTLKNYKNFSYRELINVLEFECNKNGNAAVFNNGNITINNGKLQRTTDVSGNGYYTAVNHGTMTINGGIFMSGGEFSSMIENGYWDYHAGNITNGYVQGQNAEAPTLTINDGTFAGGLYAIKNDDNAVLNINGGTFYNTILANGKSMTITDGYFENSKQSQGEYNLYLRKLSEDINPQNTYISGGTFITAQDSNFKVEGDPHIEISGGRFNRILNPAYLASGYTQVLENGFYVVKKEE